ncbi:hypothetical protein Cyrtocomes_01202 [Candidatus Cyrtobacter comes]|uniref:Transposase n=1 Tax=Candidatus Cyrtobacter comes TaxID=675776 RepID=A0ABU5L9I9_9RICK|nr:hypothetical protein [Candidatus Cyrtobacter comes]
MRPYTRVTEVSMSGLWVPVYAHKAPRCFAGFKAFSGDSVCPLRHVYALGIAKIFKVSDVAVLKWIRAFSDEISMPTEPAEVIQIDEIENR